MNRLGDFIRIKHGYAFKGSGITQTDSGKVLVTPGNFKLGGGFKDDKCKYYSLDDYPNEYVLKSGDIVVTMTDLSKESDTLGYGAYVPYSKNHIYLHNQRIGLVEIISDKIDKNFLYWLLRTPRYQKSIVATQSGSVIHHTSPERIYDYQFELPPLNVQVKIGRILNSYERKIELNNKINKNLRSYKYKDLIRHLPAKTCFCKAVA